MEGEDLLEKEKRYRELNEKLESRTRELLHEVNNVMKSVDVEQLRTTFPRPKDVSSAPLTRRNTHLRPEECKELDLPKDVNGVGLKGLVHVLKCKAKQLQSDNDKLKRLYKDKTDECKKLQKQNEKFNEERDRWLQTNQAGKAKVTKLENQIAMLQSKLTTRDAELAALKKDADALRKEAKANKACTANLEVRLNRANEECGKSRAELEALKQNDKEQREVQKQRNSELTSAVKKVEKHKAELLEGFRKQLLIIDNLKKQKVHIECLKLSEKLEGDFMRMLDWKSSK